jgi:ferrous iron transport protein B
MDIRIALAGNPNSGKTTLFNALTGSTQFVGNWPGVTVEKKEGKLRKFDGVTVTDLPGIYSLSPYTLEEVVARNYLIEERPDAILNIVDGTNLERNLYLTTQLTELGIPVVVAINMMDIVRRKGDSFRYRVVIHGLEERLGVSAKEFEKQLNSGELYRSLDAGEAARLEEVTTKALREMKPVEFNFTLATSNGPVRLHMKSDYVTDKGSKVEYICLFREIED